ncbi:MAG: hypothetical protein E6679_09000 [Staphylococcus epidermidis]|nr:hypothetical protein [Staphylococcus epidermidis]
MKIRLTFIILAILSTIGLVLVLAKYPTGPHTINYNEPYTVLIAITTIGQIVIMLMASLTILALLVSSIVTLSVHPSTSDKIN